MAATMKDIARETGLGLATILKSSEKTSCQVSGLSLTN